MVSNSISLVLKGNQLIRKQPVKFLGVYIQFLIVTNNCNIQKVQNCVIPRIRNSFPENMKRAETYILEWNNDIYIFDI